MARPKKADEERRSLTVRARVTMSERDYIEQQARIAGIEITDYLRRRALDYVVPESPGHRSDPALVSELARIGNNVNQIARAIHRGRAVPDYWREVGDQLQKTLEKLLADDP